MTRLRVGVDLGGTKIEAVVASVDAPSPKVVARKRVTTRREDGYDAIVDRVASIVRDVENEAGVSTPLPVGVGMPGGVTFRRVDGSRSELALVKNSNTTCLNGRPFRADLERALGRTVTFSNDANCFALAEATWGSARNARVAFGVILGTGVGGGVALRDHRGVRVWDGAQGIAGEWGHVVLDPERGPSCYCGRRGCVETYLSGPALELEYRARSGVGRTLPEIAVLASGGDPLAATLLAERVELFGRALATVIDILDPDVVVLGGGVSNLGVLYDEGRRAVSRWVFNDELRTQIVKPSLGESAGVYGAALLDSATGGA